MTALFLAVSTFGGVLTEPLLASAADSYQVRVEVLNKDNSTNLIQSASDYNQGTFVLATVRDKKTDAVLGWNYEMLTPVHSDRYYYNVFPKTVEFTEFYKYTDGSENDKKGEKLAYDPDTYNYKYRVYRADGQPSHSYYQGSRRWYDIKCYNDIAGRTVLDMTGQPWYTVSGLLDTFPGYTHDAYTDGDVNVFYLS